MFCDDQVGTMLCHALARLPKEEADAIKTKFKFSGKSLGVELDLKLHREIMAYEKQRVLLTKNQK